MPKILIEATEIVRYKKEVEVTEDELFDLEMTANDHHVDIADLGLTKADADFGNGLESVDITVIED